MVDSRSAKSCYALLLPRGLSLPFFGDFVVGSVATRSVIDVVGAGAEAGEAAVGGGVVEGTVFGLASAEVGGG